MNFKSRTRAFHRGTVTLGVSLAALIASQGISKAQEIYLDAITIIATKIQERTSEALAGVSTVRGSELKMTSPTRVGEIFTTLPGTWTQERADDPATAVNIRGLQDFGRVAVTIDGARQNFQRTGHNADGVFYIEPETIGGVDVVRGPTSNIYGSGAIGGVVSFRTKDAEDILRPGEKYATEVFGLGSAGGVVGGVGSIFSAVRMGPNAEIFFGGTYRDMESYKDAHGSTVPNSGNETWTGILKGTFRPADGHQVKLGYTHLNSDYVSGQPFIPTTGPFTGTQISSILDTNVVNQIANARWTYYKPEDRVYNFDANVYWTSTSTDQTKLGGLTPPFGLGTIGSTRNFSIETVGFDFNNTSRFDTGGFNHAFTWGVDGFRDKVDTSGFGVVFTPSGERTVSGGFMQLKSMYSTWLEIISAVRYDQYSLEGGGVSTDGSRVSPKITIGVTPVRGFQPYATYAEGYRAPAVTETLISGLHDVFGASFNFYPNPALKPEVGKNKELGINLRYDNIARQGDTFRGKFNWYRNDVDNFIDQFGSYNPAPFPGAPTTLADGSTCPIAPGLPSPFIPDCIQYRNIAKARLQGFEWDSSYDAGSWYLGFAASTVDGKNVETGAPLAKIPPWFTTTTLGLRSADRKYTAVLRWQYVADKPLSDIPFSGPTPAFSPTDHFNLVNLYLTAQVSKDAQLGLAVENLLNQQYTKYMSGYPYPDATVTGAFPPNFAQPGLTVKGSYRVRFAG